MLFHKLRTLPLLICVALIAASCGSPPVQSDSEIATAVAQTVQAQNSLTKVSALPTLTPAPALQATATPLADPTNMPGPAVSNPGCITSAGLVSENPPMIRSSFPEHISGRHGPSSTRAPASGTHPTASSFGMVHKWEV